jgi:hypothetical protein
MDNTVLAGGTSAILVSVLMQALKRSDKVAWITKETGKFNAVLGVVLAAVTAAGVRYAFDYDDTTGDVVMNVSFNVVTVGEWLKQTAGQWAVQQGYFSAFIRPSELQARQLDVLERLEKTQRAQLGGF